MSHEASWVHLNGRLVAAAKAKVSALDRGLLYGDGLFETVRVYRGVPFALEEHVARLNNSSHLLGIVLPAIDWRERIHTLLARNRLLHTDARVRMTVTRGVGPLGLLPPTDAEPTLLITAEPVGDHMKKLQKSGVAAILLPFGREGFLAEHKTLDYLPGVLGRTLAARHQAYEALYVTATGRVTEGTTSNLFIVRGGRLSTPPIRGILPGVTRAHVIDLAEAAGIPVAHQTLSLRTLGTVDEAFLTSSTAEVLPLVRLDDHPVGSGHVGPVTRRVQRLYQSFVAQRLLRGGHRRKASTAKAD